MTELVRRGSLASLDTELILFQDAGRDSFCTLLQCKHVSRTILVTSNIKRLVFMFSFVVLVSASVTGCNALTLATDALFVAGWSSHTPAYATT